MRGNLIFPTGSQLSAPGRSAAAPARKRACANILGTAVDALDLESALAQIASRMNRGPKGYVCAVSVHGILEAMRCDRVADALANASFRLPDGTPTVWMGRLQGHAHMDHVTGPAIMQSIFSRREFAAYSHFLYGGKPGVAEELAATLQGQFDHVTIAGTYTPPFRELTAKEEKDLVERVRQAKPDIIWVGISTPRQDLFMRRMIARLDTRLMFGVGAAFDFLTGRVRSCPDWMKRAGFNWLHRLAQDPARLWRRNVANTAFLWHACLQLSGLRDYALTRLRGPFHEMEDGDLYSTRPA